MRKNFFLFGEMSKLLDLHVFQAYGFITTLRYYLHENCVGHSQKSG